MTSFAVHEFGICVMETIGFDDLDSGLDTIFGSDGRDILFGGGGNDVIYGLGGDDIIFGDQGKVSCTTTPYDPEDPRNGRCVDLDGTVDLRATNVATSTGSGNDLVYAGSGDDIVLGQQGDDILYGEADDDLLIGGSNVSGALDGDDVIDGGSGNDLIAGDNADCCRRADTLDPRMRALQGTVIYGTSLPSGNDGHALVTGTAQNDPTGIQQYRITVLDHSDYVQTHRSDLWGDDFIAGGADADELYGELGADTIQGDGYVNGLVLDLTGFGIDPITGRLTVGGKPITATVVWPTIKTRAQGVVGAWRDDPRDTSADETLEVHPSVEQTTDGDDYIEGNGGADTIFGNLGQDDIVGDSSDLFGLGDDQRLTLSKRVAGVTTVLTGSDGKPVQWRVVNLTNGGLTLNLAGTAAGLTAGTATLTVYGAGIQEPVTVDLQVVTGGIALTAQTDWSSFGSFCFASTPYPDADDCRPTGADSIFGGAGTEIARGDIGAATLAADGSIITEPTGHARDADAIAGDNAQIFRLVGTNGAQRTPNTYLTFAYDTYTGGLPPDPAGRRTPRLHLRRVRLQRDLHRRRPRCGRRDPRRGRG